MSKGSFLDELVIRSQTGFGELGLHGRLGYENGVVEVGGLSFAHSISAHPPSRVSCRVDGRFDFFETEVAINGDVPRSLGEADFAVFADGRPIASAEKVLSGQTPRKLSAWIRGADCLHLVIATRRWRHCHAVWLNPSVRCIDEESPTQPGALIDCLERTEIERPPSPIHAHRCVATIASEGYESMLDGLLASLNSFGNVRDAARVVFIVNNSSECRRIALAHGAIPISCRSLIPRSPNIKSALYSLSSVVNADAYLCIDADALVLGDMNSVFEAVSACARESILVCGEANMRQYKDLRQAFAAIYRGTESELNGLCGPSGRIVEFPFVVNDGVFAGTRSAMRSLDGTIRSIVNARTWVDSRPDIPWRNQFIFNLALAITGAAVELRPQFNLQLHAQHVDVPTPHCAVSWGGEPIRILHFSGNGKLLYSAWRQWLLGAEALSAANCRETI